MRVLYISLFGLVGIWGRYLLGIGVSKFLPPPFPYGVFIANVVGAFLIGVIYVLGVEKMVLSEAVRLGIIVGLLGGFTTFSSYCLDTAELLEEGEWLVASAYWIISPVIGLAAAFVGLFITRYLLKVN